MFTDPVVISGPVTNDELALRSSIRLFLFVPPAVNEHLIADAGFKLIEKEDVTENAAEVSGRCHNAREHYRNELIEIEGKDALQACSGFSLRSNC